MGFAARVSRGEPGRRWSTAGTHDWRRGRPSTRHRSRHTPGGGVAYGAMVLVDYRIYRGVVTAAEAPWPGLDRGHSPPASRSHARLRRCPGCSSVRGGGWWEPVRVQGRDSACSGPCPVPTHRIWRRHRCDRNADWPSGFRGSEDLRRAIGLGQFERFTCSAGTDNRSRHRTSSSRS